MAQTQTEREDKYDVDAAFVVPSLDGVRPEGGRIEHNAFDLEAVYFDTDNYDLRRARITLRRRQGGTDAGWHLKLPAGVARTELHLPFTASSVVPKELADLTLGLRRGRRLRRVATLRTHRIVLRLLDADGAMLAEVADDTVHASAVGDSSAIGATGAVGASSAIGATGAVGASAARLSSWREVEVELGAGDPALLDRVGKRLRQAGAKRSDSASKLSRALGPVSLLGGTDGPLLDYLRAQCAAIDDGDVGLRRELDVIHPTRVATRRLRSTLRIYGKLFDADRAVALDAELSWFAQLLGDVRDQEVLGRRLGAAVASLPPELVLGPVAERIGTHLRAERIHHLHTLHRAMNGRRYLALLTELDRWRADPPWRVPAAAAQDADVARGLARAQRQLARKVAIAFKTDIDEDLHAARKAGKRARYAAELAAPVIGAKRARRSVKRYTALQDLLGDHQDAVVAATLLRTLGARAGVSKGENGFTYGLLYALEQQRGRESRDAAARLIRRALK